MGLSLVHIFEAGILVGNGMAILNEKRFLKPRGLANAVGVLLRIVSTTT